MKSYKLRKVTETALFAVENELSEMRKETEAAWGKTITNVASVVFSGIGTSFLFNDYGIPALLSFTDDWGEFKRACFYIFAVLGVFVVFTIVVLNVVKFYRCLKAKFFTNKSTPCKRKGLIDYFHKVILNDIIVGISFIKKYFEEKTPSVEDDEIEVKENIMYLFEAYYYFSLAYKEIYETHIFELNKNRANDIFLKEVGIGTLKSMLSTFIEGVEKLTEIIPDGNEKASLAGMRTQLNTWNNLVKTL